jgi:hypothetical protein
LMLLAVAAVAGAMYVAAAPGSRQAAAPSEKQFSALKKEVAGLSKKLTALKKDESGIKALAGVEAGVLAACVTVTAPINQFGDAQNNPPTEGYVYDQPLGAGTFDTTALDVTDQSDPGALWIVGGTATSGCLTALGGSGLRHDAAALGLSLHHASGHVSFSAHRP